MNPTHHGRRSLLGHACAAVAYVATALMPFASATAWALDQPTGAVILTIKGLLELRNDGESASFDIGLFNQLPQHSFSARTPWFETPRKFSGVLVSDLLKAVGSRGVAMKALALNDFSVEIPLEDLIRHGALIASRLDDQPIPVRSKGPLMLMFPFDDRPEIRTSIYYSRAIWQLRSVELR